MYLLVELQKKHNLLVADFFRSILVPFWFLDIYHVEIEWKGHLTVWDKVHKTSGQGVVCGPFLFMRLFTNLFKMSCKYGLKIITVKSVIKILTQTSDFYKILLWSFLTNILTQNSNFCIHLRWPTLIKRWRNAMLRKFCFCGRWNVCCETRQNCAVELQLAVNRESDLEILECVCPHIPKW